MIEVFFGVLSGVITATILCVAPALLHRFVIPWYQEMRYQGIDLRGTWIFNPSSEGSNADIKMTIKQSAHQLSGNAQLIFKNEEGQDIEFEVHGSVWEGYLTLNLRSTDRTRISFITMLLKVAGGGGELKGFMAARNVKNDCVDSHDLSFTRQ